jgi:hypothetical protein
MYPDTSCLLSLLIISDYTNFILHSFINENIFLILVHTECLSNRFLSPQRTENYPISYIPAPSLGQCIQEGVH